MATHSSILAWRIPWTEEPGRLQSIHPVPTVPWAGLKPGIASGQVNKVLVHILIHLT